MITNGHFDLKGLGEWGLDKFLDKVPHLTNLKNDLRPLVGAAMQEAGIPEMLELGLMGTLAGKVLINVLQKRKQVADADEQSKQPRQP